MLHLEQGQREEEGWRDGEMEGGAADEGWKEELQCTESRSSTGHRQRGELRINAKKSLP